jgi:hypothetical protein
MNKLAAASIILALPSFVLALPMSSNAADLSDNFVFIEESLVPPAPSVVGHLEFAAGWWHRDITDAPQTDEAVLLDGRGRINIPFAGNWNLELEAGGNWLINADNSISDADLVDIGNAAHLWLDFSGFRVGAFGAADYLNNASEVWVWSAGGEAEIDVGNNLTLGIQGAYIDGSCTSPCDLFSVSGWADFYPNPNTKLGIQGGYVDLLDNSSPIFQFWNIWGTAEHRFDGTAFSVFARGGYEASFEQVVETYVITAGLRVFFDGNVLTLQEHDRQVPFEFRLPQITNSFGL